jgi:hypothetical protein
MADCVPNPNLPGVPQSRPTRIFRFVAQRLQTSERLKGVVKKWKFGFDPADLDPKWTPDATACPFVRVTLDGVAGEGMRDNVSQSGKLILGVEVWAKGFDATDVVDLFMRVVDVVFAADPGEERAFRDALGDLGTTRTPVDIMRWANPAPVSDKGLQVGKGQLGWQFKIQG